MTADEQSELRDRYEQWDAQRRKIFDNTLRRMRNRAPAQAQAFEICELGVGLEPSVAGESPYHAVAKQMTRVRHWRDRPPETVTRNAAQAAHKRSVERMRREAGDWVFDDDGLPY